MTNDERTQENDMMETKTAADGGTPTDREGELAVRRKAMFDLLRKGGYDSVEVEYEGELGVYQVQDMIFHKGSEALPHYEVPDEVGIAVWAFVDKRIPTEQVYTRWCDGLARIYTASGYTCFRQHAETRDYFWDGNTPGEEVPEEDIYPTPEEEFAEFHVDDCDCGDQGQDDDGGDEV